MRTPTLLAAVLVLVAPFLAHADGMRIEPGQWEFTTTSSGAMGGAPANKVHTQCIREDSMTPQRFTQEMKGCRIDEPKFDASSMSWKMSCPSSAGAMTGSGSFRSTGSGISGTIDVTMRMGDQEFPMTNRWTGRRLGACP
jgi:hypothetical protein